MEQIPDVFPVFRMLVRQHQFVVGATVPGS